MEKLPILPLRGVVVYPLIGVTIDVGRPLSLRALLAAKEHETDLVVVTQKETGNCMPYTGVKVYFIHIQVILVLLPNMLREKIVFLSLC